MMKDAGVAALNGSPKKTISGNIIPEPLAAYLGQPFTEELNVALHRKAEEVAEPEISGLLKLFKDRFSHQTVGIEIIDSTALVPACLMMTKEGKGLMTKKLLHCAIEGYSQAAFNAAVWPPKGQDCFPREVGLENEMEEIVRKAMDAVANPYWDKAQLYAALTMLLVPYAMHAGFDQKKVEFEGLQGLLDLFPKYILAGSIERDLPENKIGVWWFLVK